MDGLRRGYLIFDVVGGRPIADYRRALTPAGTYVIIGHDRYDPCGRVLGAIPSFLKLAVVSPFVSQRLGLGREKQTEPALLVLKRLLDEGAVTPLVDGCYPLDEVADAMCHLESGQVCGKIVITP